MVRNWPHDRREQTLSSRACFGFAGVFALLAVWYTVVAFRHDADGFDRVLAVAWVGIVIAWIVRGVLTRRREADGRRDD